MKNDDGWKTMSDYAREVGLSREGVRKAVRDGRLESNGKTGRECRVRGEIMPSVRAGEPRRRKQAAKPALKVAPAPEPETEPEPEAEAEAEAPEGDTLFDEMKAAKMEKLRNDIALQQQRLTENRDAMKREIYADVAGCYTYAFSALKSHIVEIRLPAAKLAVLRKIMEECIAIFEAEMRKRQNV